MKPFMIIIAAIVAIAVGIVVFIRKKPDSITERKPITPDIL